MREPLAALRRKTLNNSAIIAKRENVGPGRKRPFLNGRYLLRVGRIA